MYSQVMFSTSRECGCIRITVYSSEIQVSVEDNGVELPDQNLITCLSQINQIQHQELQMKREPVWDF